jgi:excisionase family DNA binding protein
MRRIVRLHHGAKRMPYTLQEASEATGLNRSTIFRAIRAGKISAVRNEQGTWQIEPAELHRVYPPLATPDVSTARTHHDAMADKMVQLLERQLEDMRQERDHWRTAFEQERERAQRALPVPTHDGATGEATPAQPAEQPSRLRRAWRWMRTTG